MRKKTTASTRKLGRVRHDAKLKSGKGTFYVLEWNKIPSGEEWRLRSTDGKLLRLTTTASSTSAMDDAVVIYSKALERLAKR
ncbi:MAG: hypothetical protein HY659_11175 [Rhizobiales bacterium]|nr:hypothetical protein [Hyphomicrobiales bacterium]